MSHGKVTLTHILFSSLKKSLCVFTKIYKASIEYGCKPGDLDT